MELSRKKLIVFITTVILLVAFPLTLYLVKQTQIFKPRATGEVVVFTLNPQQTSKPIGQPLDVEVNLNSGTVGVDALLLTIKYDPAILKLESFDDNLAAQLGNVKNEINLQNGRLTYESVETGQTSNVRGSVKVGTLRFTTLALTPANTPTLVTFERAEVANASITGIISNKTNGSYTITGSGSTLNNIIAHVFYDTNRNGQQDGNDLSATSVYGKLTGPTTRDQISCCPSDAAGNINFNTLVSGAYTISLHLRDNWEVTNPDKLSVQLPTNANVTTNIGIMVKSSYAIPGRTGSISGPSEYRVGESAFALYVATARNLLFGKVEMFRVRNNGQAYIADPNNWIRVGNPGSTCTNLGCQGPVYSTCNYYGTNWQVNLGIGDSYYGCNFEGKDWQPTNTDVGSWLVFPTVHDFSNNTKCTGNPYWNQVSGYADCSGTDVVQTNIIGGASPSPSASVNVPQVPTPSAAMVTANGCLSGPVTGTATLIQWVNNNYRAVEYVDISTSANFATYYHKNHASFANLSAYVSTYAPEGFNGFSGVTGPLTLQPNTTYYVRLFDGTRHSGTVSFNAPLCPASSNQCPIGQIICARTGSCMTSAACNCTTAQPLCPRTGTCLAPNVCNPAVSPTPSASVASCTQSNGDANRDGAVNLLDYNIWRDEIIGVRTTKQSDFNCDTVINLLDHNIWRTEMIRLIPQNG